MNITVTVDNRHIHPTAHNQFAESGAKIFIEIEHNPGMLALDFCQQRDRQQLGSCARRQPDRNLTAQGLACTVDGALRLLALAQNRLSVGIENFSGVGWRDPSFGTN